MLMEQDSKGDAKQLEKSENCKRKFLKTPSINGKKQLFT